MTGKKIAFIHPDLGIGGAERLVVDAAVGLQEQGNQIEIYTSHCDRTHCFEEVSSELLKVQVYGDFLPTNILNKFHIFCAILRQFFLVAKLVFTGEVLQYDYFIIDQLSFCIPILVLFKKPETKILFYCHFPDQLLAKPSGTLKKLYRIPFDFIEEYTTSLSDKIIVNSDFTKSVFHDTFNIKQDPNVIYPCVDIDQALIETDDDAAADKEVQEFFKGHRFFISINRFERKKNIELAIKSYKYFRDKLDTDEVPKLVISGGFDPRVSENVEYLHELEELAKSLDLKPFIIRGKLLIMPPAADILLLPSIKTTIKKALIKQSDLLVYTPRNEHFGIVPVESMLFKTPVLAADNGGPIESITNYYEDPQNATGFNVTLDENEWGKTMGFVYESGHKLKEELGANGFKIVLKKFSRQQMSQSFMDNLLLIEKLSDKGLFIGALSLLLKLRVGILVLFSAAILHRLGFIRI